MGKVRRVRQKLHQSSSKSITGGSLKVEQEEVTQLLGKSPLLNTSIPDNLFEGINIDFDNLKNKLEDDRISVRSIAKSCKYDSTGKLLTKKEKKKLKHDLFMRKINSAQQLKKEALQKQKTRKGLNKSDLEVDSTIQLPPPVGIIKPTDASATLVLDEVQVKKKGKKSKPKGIKKAKVRQREMLEEIAAFRKIITDEKFSKDPSAVITQCVQKRIVEEIKKK